MRRFAFLLACLMLAAHRCRPPKFRTTSPRPSPRPSAATKDRERDARDKPAELLTFAGVKPGMKVADVFGGGGYWSEIIARAVGPTGSVTLVNNAAYYNYGQEDIKDALRHGRLKDSQAARRRDRQHRHGQATSTT